MAKWRIIEDERGLVIESDPHGKDHRAIERELEKRGILGRN